jgi:Fic family protein
MEPLLLPEGSPHRAGLNDLALELAQRSSGFRRSLPPSLVRSLAGLVRSMNCYYSNLIEGHDTHPVDIERALKGDYSSDARKRDLQLEATAHIAVQAWIDDGALADRALDAEVLREIHRRFCAALPGDLLWVDDPVSGKRLPVVPGEFRQHHVIVGRHVPVSPGAVPRFIARLTEVHGRLGRIDTIVAAAAAHHRLLWIHPFLDGNGRVARLMSHAVLLQTLDTGAVWSVARGLARNVDEYKTHLASCDQPRRNDLDGRGALSEECLVEFSRFFLRTCLDQVRFMEGLMQPETLRTRMRLWVEEEVRLGRLPKRSGAVLDALLYRGELPRGEVAGIVDAGERQGRRVVAALMDAGVITSRTARTPLHLAFPATLASRWMPGLFPER